MIRLLRIVLMTAIWLALWSDISVANVVSGVVVGVLVTAGVDTWRRGQVVVRPVRAVIFGAFFLRQLALSTIAVARSVVAPRDRVRTGIVAVPLLGCSDAVATLIADAISLTPGTLTLEVRREPLTLYVHALDTRDVEELRKEIRVLEVLAVRAFGDAEALAGLPQDDTRVWRGR